MNRIAFSTYFLCMLRKPRSDRLNLWWLMNCYQNCAFFVFVLFTYSFALQPVVIWNDHGSKFYVWLFFLFVWNFGWYVLVGVVFSSHRAAWNTIETHKHKATILIRWNKSARNENCFLARKKTVKYCFGWFATVCSYTWDDAKPKKIKETK